MDEFDRAKWWVVVMTAECLGALGVLVYLAVLLWKGP
jgi:hypothetical protein